MRRKLVEEDGVDVLADRKVYAVRYTGNTGRSVYEVNKKNGSVQCFFPRRKRASMSLGELDGLKVYLRKAGAPKELIDKLHIAKD